MNRLVAFFLLFSIPLCADFVIEKVEELPTTDTEKFIRHCSTLLEVDGDLLVCYYHGISQGDTQQEIYFQKWSHLTNTWSGEEQTPIAAQEKDRWHADVQVACWDPVLTYFGEEVLLFYKAGTDTASWVGFFKKYDAQKNAFFHPYDPDGKSYHHGEDPFGGELLPGGIIGPAKNKPLTLEDGTLVCGSSFEGLNNETCWVDILHPDGTWTKAGPITYPNYQPLYPDYRYGINQPTLVFSSTDKNTIRMLTRSRKKQGDIGTPVYLHQVCTTLSHDGGKTWGPVSEIQELPNPDTEIDALNLDNGQILIVYNNATSGRGPLSLALSEDGGETWKYLFDIEPDPENGVSYYCPAIIQTSDGKIHITYTYRRHPPSENAFSTIKHMVIGFK